MPAHGSDLFTKNKGLKVSLFVSLTSSILPVLLELHGAVLDRTSAYPAYHEDLFINGPGLPALNCTAIVTSGHTPPPCSTPLLPEFRPARCLPTPFPLPLDTSATWTPTRPAFVAPSSVWDLGLHGYSGHMYVASTPTTPALPPPTIVFLVCG